MTIFSDNFKTIYSKTGKRGHDPRLQGLRKVRMPLQSRSRSGGARVIYLYLPQHQAVIFFYIYTKAKSENLTPDQEKRLKAAVETIKREFRHENQGH